jgi:predicted TIM-barrel fold metal-dependent hydrolase
MKIQESLLRHLRVLEIVHRDGGRQIGIDRFMFGTDYPYIIADPSYIEALNLPAGQKQQIFGGNGQRLFAQRLAI